MKKCILSIALSMAISVSIAQSNWTAIRSTSSGNSIALSDIPTNFYNLFVNGRVKFTRPGFLFVVKDTAKISVKYADSIFILRISPKFVKKINDSTYTFKNE